LAELNLSNLSVVENSDPILKEISSKKSFDDRVAVAEEHYEKLGEGSARTIFKVSDKLVLKVAHNDKGIVQNLAEMKPGMQRPCTNPVVAADAKGKWVLVRFTENITKEEFKKEVGHNFDDFTESLFYKFNNESDDWPPPSNYDEVRKSELFKCIVDLVADCDLQIGDIDKPDSWGRLDGKIILRDYGLTRDIYNEYYDDDSSRSPKSSSSPSSKEQGS
jgi:hypothetical protein